MRINNKNCLDLIRGASLMTTGGGIPIADQLLSIKKLKNLKVKLQTLKDFPGDSFICLAAELGPTDVPPLDKEKTIKKMLFELERITNEKISGIYPPEIGQESVVMEASHFLNLPVADFDPVGFRAVPYIDINIFNLKGIDVLYTPMVVSTDKDEIFVLDSPLSYLKLEDALRQMTQLSNRKSIFLLGAVLSIKNLVKHNIGSRSYSRALKLSRIKTINKLVEKLKPKLAINAVIVDKKEVSVKGFFAEVVKFKNEKNKIFKMIVLNEILFIMDNKGKVLASVPDKILLIDSKRLCGLSTTNLSRNTKALILVTDPEKEWRISKAQKIFGRDRFKNLLREVKKYEKS